MFLFGKKNSVGINISDYSIKVVELENDGENIFVKSSNQTILGSEIVVKGRIKNKGALLEAVKDALLHAKPLPIKPENVFFALPERQVFVHFFPVSKKKINEIDKIVGEEAAKGIPIHRDELATVYRVFNCDKTAMIKVVDAKTDKKAVEEEEKEREKEDPKDCAKAVIAAAEISAIDEWHLFFKELGVEIKKFDLETLATYRGVFARPTDEPCCVVDIGATATNISIFSHQGIIYSHTIGCAGNYFSKKLREGVKKDSNAEYTHEEIGKLKREIGMVASEKYNNVAVVLKGSVLPIVDEVTTALKYYNEISKGFITDIILVGGSSRIKGLADYLASNLSGLKFAIKAFDAEGKELEKKDVKVRLGEVAIVGGADVVYAEAIGLAMKAFDKNWAETTIALPVEFDHAASSIEEEEESGESNEVVVGEEKESYISAHKKIIQLIFVVLFGGLAIGWAFWYRHHAQVLKEREALEQAQKIKDVAIAVALPVVTDKSRYTAENIKGRIYKDVVKEGAEAAVIMKESKARAEAEIKKEEVIWKESLTTLSGQDLIFPLTIEWLVYSERDVKSKFLGEIKRKLGSEIKFTMKKTEVKSLEKKGNEYYLAGEITITTEQADKIKPEMMSSSSSSSLSSSQVSSTPSAGSGQTLSSLSTPSSLSTSSDQMPASTTDEKPKPKSIQELSSMLAGTANNLVEINGGSAGWVNVRQASSTKAEIVGKAYNKNIYPYSEESEDWLKIKLEDGVEGWVYKRYAKIIEK